ncbi:MAG TPA: hypothetical protein VFA04_25945 [Bryobacteraceae bacterium]|nr:hypothetical protein [Bryobacteraceae bacterium]
MIASEFSSAVESIIAAPVILGLGDLKVLRTGRRAGHVELLLEDPVEAILWVADLQPHSADEVQIMRLVEHWAIIHGHRPCLAILVAEDIPPRLANVLAVLRQAVPLFIIEMQANGGAKAPRFRRLVLR